MAERVVSPAVFTRERDLSFLEQGVAEIGAAFIGPTAKGPAFIPQIVESQTDFERVYGVGDGTSYMPYAVNSYLSEAARATVVRVLGLGGYEGTSAQVARLELTGSGGNYIFAVIHPSVSASSLVSATVGGLELGEDFDLTLSGSDGSFTQSNLSAFSGSSAYALKRLGTNVDNRKGGYVYAIYPDAYDLAGGAGGASASVTVDSALVDFTGQDYNNATTPWIKSQTVGGDRQNLFKFHTLNDGTNANKDVKISIQSIKPGRLSGSFGTFSVLVRAYSDTDQKVEILEQFDNLTLDPTSTDFVLRRIGTSAPYQDPVTSETYYAGDFSNKSRYVRIEGGPEIYSVSSDALPYGFAAVTIPLVAGASVVPPAELITTRWYSGSNTDGFTAGASEDVRTFYGWNGSILNDTNRSYQLPIPTSATTAANMKTSSGSIVTEFSLENLSDNEADGTRAIDLRNADVGLRKFTVPFQGGFDGFAPNTERAVGQNITSTNTQGFNLSVSTTSGSEAYKRAIDSISNPEAWDINLLTIPGVNHEQHQYITEYALQKVEDRQDCFYIMDLASWGATIETVTERANALDTNYAGGYYPWVRVLDPNTGLFLWAPPSVVLPEVYAFNDNVAAEWFAPAGLNRGGIPGAQQVKSRLPLASRDQLYENKVNPIVTFPGTGIVAYGQKTLQESASALDRINVRRLLIAVKKFIASSSRYLVFEQNTETTRNRFLNIVNPYLASVQERQGLYAFRVVMDETNNTPDIIDRNILKGDIYLQPTKTAEFIILDFNILPTGATFPNG
ncbi:MAG: phage tail sheath C-terminal domain-containing protein [Betaproteobacteria bacterium]|jgi:hypothetical protein